MKRGLLTLLLACLCGCGGRVDADLLQARIREQASQLTDSQREIAKTRTQLKRARLEAERLRAELAEAKSEPDSTETTNPKISRLRIHRLASGGMNKNDQPGDDVVVVQFAPLDSDNEPLKVPGEVELTLLDPLLPESERQLGQWDFTIDECRERWTRGITSSGYQFNLPLEQPPQHEDLVVYIKFKSADEQKCDVNHVVKVTVPPKNQLARNRRPRPKPTQPVDDFDDNDLPPVGRKVADRSSSESDVWENDEADSPPIKPGHSVQHSANWTDATIPQYR